MKVPTMKVRIVKTNLQGLPVGESHHFARYPDALIEQAKAMRAQGQTLRAIAAELGVSHSAVHQWSAGLRRRPHARVVARRVKNPDLFNINRQKSGSNPASMRPAGKPTPGNTDKKTDIERP